jgi:long-subunit fatty acid transport protein
MVSAQQLQPAPTFRLLNSGYGATALGMGGAFTAVANDLSAIYWNPAGLAQLPGLQLWGDYRAMNDSDEDFGPEVFPDRVESMQRFAVSGNQFQTLAVSYAFNSKSGALFVPAFSWQKLGTTGPDRDLKDLASVNGLFPNGNSYLSEGKFSDSIQDDEEEFAFAFAARVHRAIMVGGSWSFLRNGPKQSLNGTFEDTVAGPGFNAVTDLTLSQNYHEDRSGNYLKIGALFYPQTPLSFGVYLRFPYTVKSDIFLEKTGPFTRTDTTLDSAGNIVDETTTTGSLNLNIRAQSELDVPLEYGAGIAIRPSNTLLTTASVTYANWQDVTKVISNSTDPSVLPNETLPYPTLRATAWQNSVLQWRLGTEYLFGQFGRGLVVRAGYLLDSQPYSKPNGDRVYFHGYSFGAGFGMGSFRVDGALISEHGHVTLTPNSAAESNFQNRRWEFSVGYLSR